MATKNQVAEVNEVPASAPAPAPEPKTPITKVIVVIEGHEGFTVEGEADKVQREARRRIRAHGLTVKNAVEAVDNGTRTVSFTGEAAAAFKEKAVKAPKAESNGNAPTPAADPITAQVAAPVVTEGQADPNINSDDIEYNEADDEAADKDEESWE